MATKTAPRTRTCVVTGPASAWTNCGKKARKNSATFGLVMPPRRRRRRKPAGAHRRRLLQPEPAVGAELAHREVDEVGDPGVLDDRERDDGRGDQGGQAEGGQHDEDGGRRGHPQRRGQRRAAALGDAAADDVEQVGPGKQDEGCGSGETRAALVQTASGLRSLIVPFGVPPVSPGPVAAAISGSGAPDRLAR